MWKHKHLLGIEPLSREDIELILDQGEKFLEIARRPIKKVPTLRGYTIMTCFYEPSTRTRVSFEIAAKRLGADTASLSIGTSSMAKGETILDTALNLQAMVPDVLVVRHHQAGAPHFLARHLNCSVINAGDGAHEHPTQALLDAFTIWQTKGKVENLQVAIVGDIEHSRVARSNILALKKLGAQVILCGPPTMLPRTFANYGVPMTHNIEEAIDGSDVIMALRIQRERQSRLTLPSYREYFEQYGLTLRRLRKAKPDVLIMHPGPMNRGVEIESAVADGPWSVILNQVTYGVAVRMAVLYLLTLGRQG